MKTYITDAGLGYREYVTMLRLNKSKNGYNYLIIESSSISDNENYSVGKILEDLEDIYVSESNYDIKKSELYNTFLFQHFLRTYNQNSNPNFNFKFM